MITSECGSIVEERAVGADDHRNLFHARYFYNLCEHWAANISIFVATVTKLRPLAAFCGEDILSKARYWVDVAGGPETFNLHRYCDKAEAIGGVL